MGERAQSDGLIASRACLVRGPVEAAAPAPRFPRPVRPLPEPHLAVARLGLVRAAGARVLPVDPFRLFGGATAAAFERVRPGVFPNATIEEERFRSLPSSPP